MRANQMRLWFASMAYVLLCALRRIGLYDTEYAKATCGTIRLKLLKIGALVRISVRRIKVAMASGCPAATTWGLAAVRLAAVANPRASPPASCARCERLGRLTSTPLGSLDQTKRRPCLWITKRCRGIWNAIIW
jgi:hypothetical protein